MIRLHYANRLENLIAPLARLVTEHQLKHPLDRLPIVVPNRAVEEFVRLRLCEACGVTANLEFPFLRRYLNRVVQDANPDVRIVEIEHLQLVLFEFLRNLSPAEAGRFRAVRDYGGDNLKAADFQPRLFQLAGQLGWLMREYSITRRRMLQAWRGATVIDKPPFDETERWQRELWLGLFDRDGALRSDLIEDHQYRWMMLPDAFDAIRPPRLAEILPPAIHIFGIAYAGPGFAQIFAEIGKYTDLHIYSLNPCMEFWEDVENPTGISRESWVRRQQRIAAGLDTAEDPFGLDSEADNPALRLWARPGREYVRLLNELTDCDFDPHFTHPAQTPTPTLLQRLTESILIREAQRPLAGADNAIADDGSIRFLACPGIRREAEITANAIWSLIQNDDAAHNLRFHEIAVIVPDRAQDDYLPQIETVFSELHEIPLNIVNRQMASESRVAEAVELLLRLPLGSFTRDEMLRLLTHEAIIGSETEANPQRWSQWCDTLGVFFGADQDDLEKTYVPRDFFHWDQALKRLALGVLMAGERDGSSQFFKAPDEASYLPCQVAQDETADAAKFIRLARGLIADAAEIRSAQMTLSRWAEVLRQLILTYISPLDAVDERVRDYCLAAIESIAAEGIRIGPVPYEIALECALARIGEIQARRGQFSERGVAVGSLSALRSIPFRVIFLLGMNEADFPERTRHNPLDLRLAGRRAGDVNATERDRYMFLETLLAARERIFISYIARDQQTGDPLEPSALVRELQFILRGYVTHETLDRMTVTHPTSRYDLGYFRDLDWSKTDGAQPELFSCDPAARLGARLAALRHDLETRSHVSIGGRDPATVDYFAKDVRAPLFHDLRMIEPPSSTNAAPDSPQEIALPLAALRKFLECPLQGAAQYALGMTEDDYSRDDYEDEPVAQSRLDRTMLLRNAFITAHGNPERTYNEYKSALRIAQAKGRAPVGPFAEAAEEADFRRVREWVAQASSAGIRNIADWKTVRIGHAEEFAKVDCVLPEIPLEIELPSAHARAPRTIRLRIYGSAGFMSPDFGRSLRCILGSEPKAKDFMDLFLPAIAIAAAGEQRNSQFQAVVLTAEGKKPASHIRIFEPPSKDEALAYLRVLASDMLSGRNHYFLPIEAVEAALKANSNNDDPIDAIENLRENDWYPCSSDYGPVRNARTFRPPTEAMVWKIIERRFALISRIFKTK